MSVVARAFSRIPARIADDRPVASYVIVVIDDQLLGELSIAQTHGDQPEHIGLPVAFGARLLD